MNAPAARHAAIVLAAGASRRLGRPKQLLQIDGETLLHRTVRLAQETRPAQLLVVTGHHAAAMAEAVADLAAPCVFCAAWDEGMAASLRCGIAALHADVDGALLLLCDQPALDAPHLFAMLAAWRQAPARAVASAYASLVGVPALLPRSWFDRVRTLQGDRGARALLRDDATQVVAIANERLAFDIDEDRQQPRFGER
jgi:CTP:molybdopterin cytidylyltransferase MocA